MTSDALLAIATMIVCVLAVMQTLEGK